MLFINGIKGLIDGAITLFINEAKNLYICYTTDIQKSILISN